jgi:VanZ family protein
MMQRPPHRSSATLLAGVFALLIVYASLYPFAGWRDQDINPFHFFIAPWPRYWSQFDTTANFLGYMPLGFLLALALLRSTVWPQPALIATLLASVLSALLEGAQSYLPQRVPQLSDWLLNSGGALAGAIIAVMMQRIGWVDHWSRFRARWFVQEARAPLVLLALWPAALLFPPPAPLALGQVRQRLYEFFYKLLEGTFVFPLLSEPGTYLQKLSNIGELICVALGFVIPCLLAYGVTQGIGRRAVLWLMGIAVTLAASSLSATLSYSPEHAWAWLSRPALMGLGLGMLLAFAAILLPRRWCFALLLVALVWQLSWINAAPETPYFAQTLQSWEQGRFIRFHGLAQWLGWLWPYAVLWVTLGAVVQRR